MADAADDAEAARATLARLFSGLANETRLATLQGIAAEEPLQAIAERTGVTRSAVQLQVRELVDRQLVYRDTEAAYQYQLTPIGMFFERFVRQNQELLAEVLARVDEAEQEAREELEPLLSGEPLENAVEQRKWELVSDELRERLQETEED